ncbi:hypothetical protein [Pelomonas sp. SE-A7]|uniref:alpha/beta hydrolase family protein n=1 Tax=Pelomonas sp. SE-A7 TaxID=3054953 RepID=UPI00259CD815|nr:hypothetical protein [Pelomonas sp. SE-A7]MDM4765235.1 hypothetical protein [Pelomonas sp. SE-A7]
MRRCLLVLLICTLAAFGAQASPVAPCDSDSLRQAALAAREGPAGRYGSGLQMLIVGPCGEGWAAQPLLSANPALLIRQKDDLYGFAERPERQIAFRRTSEGRIDAMQRVGSGAWSERRSDSEPEALEWLLAGQPSQAAAKFVAADLDEAAALATAVLSRLPSKRAAVLAFLEELAPRGQGSPSLLMALGAARASQGRVEPAHQAYWAAAKLDPGRPGLAAGLRLSGAGYATGEARWPLPFPLTALLAAPTDIEKAQVLADWKARKIEVTDVQELARQPAFMPGSSLALLSYRMAGQRQYGLVLLPDQAAPGCCAVLLDIKGTSPDYAPLDLSGLRPRSVRELGPAAARTLILFPGLRGERLVFGGKSYASEGDRRDGWDGAADDARGLLSAALSLYPAGDAKRVCAFGHSRGATVAMLAAIRDARLGCVAAEAGPVDWFALMGEEGWPLQSAVREGLHLGSQPGQLGGQFIERFLAPVLEGRWSLPEARHRMLASSPLYFAERLPPLLAVYGSDDASVPVANGEALRRALSRRAAEAAQVLIQPALGHDLDPVATPAAAGAFLRSRLGL